jgi:hypothetical protein
MKITLLILAVAITGTFGNTCESIVDPKNANECLNTTDKITLCCFQTEENTQTKIIEKKCIIQSMDKIGTTHSTLLNNLSTVTECGNYLASCSDNLVDDTKECKKGGDFCCYKPDGPTSTSGSCRTFPASKDFIDSYSKAKNYTVTCNGEMAKAGLLILLIGLFLF